MDPDLIILEQFINNHPFQAAQTLEGLKDAEIAAMIDEFPADITVKILSKMNYYKVAKSLELTKPDLAIALLEEMDVSIVEMILRQSEEHFRLKILNNLSPKLSTTLRKKLEHAANSVGSVVNPVAVFIGIELTVEGAINMIKQHKERISSLVPVVNSDGKLEGVILLHELFFMEGSSPIASIMKIDIPKFNADLSVESVINHPGWYDYQSIPVIDRFETLIGMLDFKTVHNNKINTDKILNKHVVETSNSLGELYRIALTGFIQSVGK